LNANQPTEAVIAGSKSFALALLAPLTERVGTRPRIASDPGQAVELTGGRGLVVVEFQGDGSLEAIRQLVGRAAELAVIAAVPEGHAVAEAALRSIGVEPARWDGRPDDVLSAVTRRLGPAPTAAPAPPLAAAAAPAPVPPAAPAAPRGAVGRLFDDLPLDAAAAPAPPLAAPPAPEPAASPAPWPADVPGTDEAAQALADGIRGVFAPAGSPLAVVAETMAAMSSLEREVLLGEAKPFDAEPIRRAAVMRVRVAVALATAPRAAGSPTDDAAVSALLAEIDALLADVAALAADVPPALQAPLEQVRNALVKEAIDFSEAAHPAEAEAPASVAAAQPATAIARKAARTRSVHIATEAERRVGQEEERRRRTAFVILAVVAVLAGGYHGYRLYRHHAAVAAASAARPTRIGAPPDVTIAESPGAGAIVIQAKGGRAFTLGELKQMEDEEALRGNTVKQLSPSSVVVVRRGTAAGADASAPAPGR
jgi:hypothetical protein